MAARFAYLDHPSILAIAHRGGTSEHPENTMAAFQAAVDLGFRYLETDVHASADGVLYAFHDPNLDRITEIQGSINEMTSAELDAVQFRGHSIPRFEDLLSTWPAIRINVDPKSDAATAPLVQAILRNRAIARVCVGSFSDRRIAWCRDQIGPDLCTSMGPREIARLVARSRGLPVGGFDAACAQIPPSQRLGLPLVGDRVVPLATARLLEAAHDLDISVHVWTIDEPNEMHDLIDMGLDGIMTDRPRVLRSVLIDRGLWSE